MEEYSKEIIAVCVAITALAGKQIAQIIVGKGQKGHELKTIETANSISDISKELRAFTRKSEKWMESNSIKHISTRITAIIPKVDQLGEDFDEVENKLVRVCDLVNDLNNMHKDSDSKFSTVHVIEKIDALHTILIEMKAKI